MEKCGTGRSAQHNSLAQISELSLVNYCFIGSSLSVLLFLFYSFYSSLSVLFFLLFSSVLLFLFFSFCSTLSTLLFQFFSFCSSLSVFLFLFFSLYSSLSTLFSFCSFLSAVQQIINENLEICADKLCCANETTTQIK